MGKRNTEMLKLNLGCGKDIRPGWINADKFPSSHEVVFCDIDREFPFESNFFDEVLSIHSAEHCRDKGHFLSEIWRVCKAGATVTILTPHPQNPFFYDDISHFSPWGEQTFSVLRNYYGDTRFEEVSRQITYFDDSSLKNWIKFTVKVIK